jgi:hypothetical protein
MRFVVLLTAACSLAAVQDPREIVRGAVNRMDQNLAATRTYTFLERSDSRELDSDGRVKTRKVRLFDVTPLEGSPYRRLVGRDDQPLSPEEQRDEEKKLQDSIAQRRNETASQRAKRIADWEKKQQRQREILREIPDAFNFRIIGEEKLDGRDAWVIEALPRPGYRPRNSVAGLFPKLHGKLWIDKAGNYWVKTEAELTENFWWGLFLARLNKGARFTAEATRVNDEVWLPKHFVVAVSARLALFRRIRLELETTYSNYRKFQVDSRVITASPE